jgi:carbon-monoxide dehydrogenase medium subunit
VVAEARLVATGVGGTPVRATAAEAILAGARVDGDGRIDGARVAEAVAALRAAIEPESDVQATAAYRRHLAGVLTERALPVACQRARL